MLFETVYVAKLLCTSVGPEDKVLHKHFFSRLSSSITIWSILSALENLKFKLTVFLNFYYN